MNKPVWGTWWNCGLLKSGRFDKIKVLSAKLCPFTAVNHCVLAWGHRCENKLALVHFCLHFDGGWFSQSAIFSAGSINVLEIQQRQDLFLPVWSVNNGVFLLLFSGKRSFSWKICSAFWLILNSHLRMGWLAYWSIPLMCCSSVCIFCDK